MGTTYLNLMPVSVTIWPAAVVRLAANQGRPFTAVVSYDPVNQGVTWSVSGAGCSGSTCGTLTNATATSVTYEAPSNAPAPATVTLKATSVTDPNQSGTAALVVMGSASQYRLQGAYAFLIQGWRASEIAGDYEGGGEMAIAGHIDIDANGNVSGIWDATVKASGGAMEPIAGNYTAESDGIGTITLRASSGTWTFMVAGTSGGDSAALWQSPSNHPPLSTIAIQSGYMLRQNTNAFSMASVQGDRVLALTFMNIAALGRLTCGTEGNVGNGQMDFTWGGSVMRFFTTGTMTGMFTLPDPLTGRGTVALTVTPGPDSSPETFHFAYYIVSNAKMLLVQSDANTWLIPVLRGEARRQNDAGTFTNASWNIPVIYNLNSDDAGSWWSPFATIGVIRPDGTGSLAEVSDNTEVVEDVGIVVTMRSTDSGTYSVSPNGRVALSLPGIPLNLYRPHVGVAYLTGVNEGYLIREQIFGTPFGYFEPQTVAPFGGYGLAGTYTASVAGPPRTFKPEQEIGLVNLATDGSATIFLSVDRGGGLFQLMDWAGTYTTSDDGRGVMNLTDRADGEQKTVVFWAVSANRLLALVSMEDADPRLVELVR
ncbi:MAG TPA: hypothetical protein VN577_07240 [Terriglobales bacterium]|nr:hypothetical protein [Terriglobales bacterium]